MAGVPRPDSSSRRAPCIPDRVLAPRCWCSSSRCSWSRRPWSRGSITATSRRSCGRPRLAFPLVIGQAVLGGVVVHTDLNPWWVTAHFAVALAFVADVIFVAANAFCAVKLPDTGGEATGGDAGFARLALFTVGATGALLLVGTYVRARSAGLAFTDWPLMNGRLVPPFGGAATAMFAHRVLAAGVFSLVLWSRSGRGPWRPARRTWSCSPPWRSPVRGADHLGRVERVLALASLGGGAPRGAVGADLGDAGRARDRLPTADAHARTHHGPAVEPTTRRPGSSLRDTVTAYVRLTKPRIIVLLLITTVPGDDPCRPGHPVARG